MSEAVGEVITVLATVEFLLTEDENGTLPHEVDLHLVARELLRAAKARLQEAAEDP